MRKPTWTALREAGFWIAVIAALLALGVAGSADQAPLTSWHFKAWAACALFARFGFNLRRYAGRRMEVV